LGNLKTSACVQNNIDSFVRLAEVADDAGVRIAVENMPFSVFTLCNSGPEIKEVLDAVGMPGSLGFCLDLGHANITGETGSLLGLADRLFNVHLHDNDGRRDQHLRIGEGTVDLPAALKRLLPGYKGPFIIEGKGTGHAAGSRERLEEMLSSLDGWDG
jgi:sugar phosphate isomerase/epimerase